MKKIIFIFGIILFSTACSNHNSNNMRDSNSSHGVIKTLKKMAPALLLFSGSTNGTIITTIGTGGRDNSLQLNTNDYPVISYGNNLLVCNDFFCDDKTVSNLIPGTFQSNSLQLNINDHPVISYEDSAKDYIKLLVCNNSYCNGTNVISRLSTPIPPSYGNVESGCSLQLNNEDKPLISYWDLSEQRLKLAVCDSPYCNGTNIITTVDYNTRVFWENSMELNSDGNPVISYFDFDNSNIKLAMCSNPTCTSSNTYVIDSSGYRINSLKLTSTDRPLITYSMIGYNELRLAICENSISCYNPVIKVIDNTLNQLGIKVSLDLDDLDNPVISYLDVGNDTLKLAKCNDLYCNNPSIVIVDTVRGTFSHSVSLKINKQGNPIISYHDESENSLKLAICMNPSCNTTFTNITTTSFSQNISKSTILPTLMNNTQANSTYQLSTTTQETSSTRQESINGLIPFLILFIFHTT